MGVGKRIKKFREEKKLSQCELAKKTKLLNQSQICKIENEDRAVKANELPIIANALDIEVSKLLI